MMGANDGFSSPFILHLVLFTITQRLCTFPSRVILQPMRLFAVSAQQSVQRLLLSDRKLSRLDSRVVNPQQRVNVVHGLRANVGQLLDLGRSILDLSIRHCELQLLYPRLDGVPAGQTVSEARFINSNESNRTLKRTQWTHIASGQSPLA